MCRLILVLDIFKSVHGLTLVAPVAPILRAMEFRLASSPNSTAAVLRSILHAITTVVDVSYTVYQLLVQYFTQ